MLTYPWKCRGLHCNHLGNTWKPLVLMTRHFDYCPSASEGDNQSVGSSAPVVYRCFPGGYNVKLYISRGRLAWWLLAFLHSERSLCSTLRGDEVGMLTHIYQRKSLRKIKGSSAITILIVHFICSLISDFGIGKHRIENSHRWHQISLLRPGIINPKKLNIFRLKLSLYQYLNTFKRTKNSINHITKNPFKSYCIWVLRRTSLVNHWALQNHIIPIQPQRLHFIGFVVEWNSTKTLHNRSFYK